MEDHNKRFLVEYFKLERCTHHWVQLTEEKALELEGTQTKLPLQKNSSYNYTTPECVSMGEYHLDMHKAFDNYVKANNEQYGGDLNGVLVSAQLWWLVKTRAHSTNLSSQRNNGTVQEQGVKEGWLGKPKGINQIL
jgi:hypothetical protein